TLDVDPPSNLLDLAPYSPLSVPGRLPAQARRVTIFSPSEKTFHRQLAC
ncbi:hypothetical protein A2U01_0102672, partial [Trifolium medium]|nr:hypothetical protein [Trifolium medium]